MKGFSLLACGMILILNAFSQSKGKSKYFEGIVEYEIKTQSYLQGISDNELRERIGSSLRLYFKNGNYMREYLDGAGYTLRKVFFHKENNMMYDYYPLSSPDTLYLIDPSEETDLSFTLEPGQTEKVLDCECPSTVIRTKYISNYLPDTGKAIMTYYFCEQLPVDPEWHKNMYIWKDVIKQHKSISVKFIEDDPAYLKQTYTATKIIWQEVPDAIFRIDPRLIQIKAPK
jgi:hypothetical protein